MHNAYNLLIKSENELTEEYLTWILGKTFLQALGILLSVL